MPSVAFGWSSWGWCCGLLNPRMELGGESQSRLEHIKFESIRAEVPSRQLDIPEWSSGRRSGWTYKFRSHQDAGDTEIQETHEALQETHEALQEQENQREEASQEQYLDAPASGGRKAGQRRVRS